MLEQKHNERGIAMEWKNVSNQDEHYFDEFPVYFHLSDFGVIMNDREAIRRNIANEWNLQFISGRYGDDLDYSTTKYGSMAKSILSFIEQIEHRYGHVHVSNQTHGFHFALEITEENGKWIYFIAAGNNGQELSTGCYLTEIHLLDNSKMKEHLQELDQLFHQIILNANVSTF